MARFFANDTRTKLAITRMVNTLHNQSIVPEQMRRAHENIIEPRVKAQFRISQRKPGATNTEGTNFSERISNSVSSGVTRQFLSITAGTGIVSKLDREDPLVGVRPSRRNIATSFLWRILEAGITKDHQITPGKGKKRLVFFWKRKGFWATPKSVTHPNISKYGPIRGRSAFYRNSSIFKQRQISYQEDRRIVNAVKDIFRLHIKRFSAR